MDLSASSREDLFSPETFFAKQDLPAVPNDNPETYCRLCLTTPEVEPLFPVSGEPNVYVMELIGKYIGIGLTIQDDYPCAVCRPCHLILDQFDLFRQNCLKVDIAIRRRRLGLDRPPPVEVKSEPQDEEDDEEEMPYIRVERNHYQCRFCTETFRSLAMFLNHCKEDHPEESRMFKCKQCNKSFMTKTARLQHIRSHQPNNGENDLTGDRVQVCEKCMVTFDSYKLLKLHLKEHHSNDPKQETLVCGTCCKQFSRITILRNHILRVHLGKLPHVCKQCGVSFGYTQQLLTHLKVQHGIIAQPDQLNQSGQSSHGEEDFDQSEELPYNLPVVPSSPAPADLQHQEEQLPLPLLAEPPAIQNRNHYTCSECSTQCASPEDLRTHRKLHQDPTWWKCTHCRNFVKHQKMHLMKKHPTIDAEQAETSFLLRYRCWLCRVYFKSLQQMEQHVATRHGVIPPPSSLTDQGANNQNTGEDDDEEGESEEPAAMAPPPAPAQVSAAAAATIPPIPPQLAAAAAAAMTVQPPGLPFLPEHLPLLLSQMENGAWEYLREMTRLMDPANLAAFATAMKIKAEPMDIGSGGGGSASGDAPCYDGGGVVDLSTGSTTSMNTTTVSDDTLLEQDDDQDSSEEEHNYIRLDNRLYQCRFCSETFRHLLLIRKHTKSQHPTEWKSFKCPHCKRRFPSAAIRDRHAHFHTLQHQFVCASCDQMYDSKKRLDQHTSSVHDPSSSNYTAERLRCGACRLSFTEKKYFDMHLKIYHQRKPQRLKNLTDRLQVCERCVTTFESREALQEHVRQVHKSDQPLRSCECPKCGKDLKTTTLLRTHILVVHLGHLPFVCQHCEAAFSTRHWLLKHIEKDHAEAAVAATALEGTDFIVIGQPAAAAAAVAVPPPTTIIEPVASASATVVLGPPADIPPTMIKCSGCDEYFDDDEKLSVHVNLVHATVSPKVVIDPESGQPRLGCGKCEKHFVSRDELDKHILKAHPTFMMLYKCPLCVKPIRYRKQHMRVHHHTEYDPKEHHYLARYKCHCCSKLFKSKRNLTSHQNTMLFQCDKCHMRFKSKKSFQSHAAIHRGNKSMLKCADCGLEFGYRARLEEHRNRYHSPHSKEVLKLLNCPYCPRLFISASNRERHVTINHPQSGFLVSCGHCGDLRCSDSSMIRKHYRDVHPNERVTFKCAECVNKIYLNFSSYKDHYKAKHASASAANGRSSEQSFSGEDLSSSAAESSFNGPEPGISIKHEQLDVEDANAIEEHIIVKVEPTNVQEEASPTTEPKTEPSDTPEAIAKDEETVKGEVPEAPTEAEPSETNRSDEKESKEDVDENHSLPTLVEPEVVESAPETTTEDEQKPVEVDGEPSANTTENSPPVMDGNDSTQDKEPEAVVTDEKEPQPDADEPSQVKDETKPEVVTENNVSLPELETNSDEPIPIPKVEEEPVLPAVEPKPDTNVEEAVEPEVTEPEVMPVDPKENELAETVLKDGETEKSSETPPSKPEEPVVEEVTETKPEPPEEKSDEQSELGEDEKPATSAEPDVDGDGAKSEAIAPDTSSSSSSTGGIAKSAKRARKDRAQKGNAEVVDSTSNGIHSTSVSSISSTESQTNIPDKDDHNPELSDTNKEPPAKRTRRKSVRCTTPTWKVLEKKPRDSVAIQKEPVAMEDCESAECIVEEQQSMKTVLDQLPTAVIVLPMLQLASIEPEIVTEEEPDQIMDHDNDCVMESDHKLTSPIIQLVDCQSAIEPNHDTGKVTPKTDNQLNATVDVVDCLRGTNNNTTENSTFPYCLVSLSRLDEDIFPPVRNHEIPLRKCIAEAPIENDLPNGSILRRRDKKKANDKQRKSKTIEFGLRRSIPRFLTCKRCGQERIARTLFSAHRRECLRSRKL